MKRTSVLLRRSLSCAALVAFAVAAPSMRAQATAPGSPGGPVEDEEEIITLSPFSVEATEDEDRYLARSTLAGTRVRTDLKDVASSISVVTAQFLQDTGAKNNQDLLVYTTNTEVGGVYGNFSGAGGSTTYGETANLLRPSNNTRVRGLDSADNTRDYFLTEIPWDSYIVDRVDMQRGPNSILFGVGSPAGIINTSINTATFANATKVENRIDGHGSFRTSLDVNQVVMDDLLAFRFAALYDRTEYQQKPAFNRDRRLFGAVRFTPKVFENGRTIFRANFEDGDVKANRPRSLPPVDAITPWFNPTHPGFRIAPDGTRDWTKYTFNPVTASQDVADWYAYAGMGRSGNSSIGMKFDYDDPAPTLVQSTAPGTSKGRNASGALDGTIDGIQFGTNFALAPFSLYAQQVLAGGSYYGNKSLADPTIYDFFHNLMDGDNKSETQGWQASNVSLAQTFFNDKLGVEFVYDWQRYQERQIAFLGSGQYFLSVDINTKLLDGRDNPNFARPYVGNSGQYDNSENYVNRDSGRITVFGDVRTEDFFGKSLLTKILGRHVFTGLVSEDLKRSDNRGFSRWASEPAFTEYQNADTKLTSGLRQVDWIAYLGNSLWESPTARGANINRIKATIAPQPYESVRFFDSTWNAPASVGFGDPYTWTSYTNTNRANGPIGGPVVNTGVQAENPANYVGWRNGTYGTLSADRGDIESLYTSGSRTRNVIKSHALTWQGYLWDGAIVPTFGWRKDTVTNANTQAPKTLHEVSLSASDYKVNTSNANTRKASGESTSFGVVVHTPMELQDKLPYRTHFSVFANKSENFKADAPRGDIFGQVIPNPTGDTKEYGIVVTTLDDRLRMKLTHYKTKVANSNLGSDRAGFGGNLYYAWAIPYWGSSHALAALDGIANPQRRQGSWGWPWNGIATNADGSPNATRIRAIVQNWFANFPLTQDFADQYGLGLNVAGMRAATTDAQYYASVPTYGLNLNKVYDPVEGIGAATLGLQPAYAGNLRDFGSGPVAVGDTTSEGWEYELTAQPTKNWNLTLNASRTEAMRTSVSPSLDAWVDSMTAFLAGDAGLIRLWGGDTMRTNWQNNILNPYGVLKAQVGQSAPEIAEWRFNIVSNYTFDSGALKGSNVGLAYRWEDKRILGYQYSSAISTLDVTKPLYGPNEDHVDLWLGYSRKISDKLNWRIQLNLRNVGEKNHLVPVNINPDGAVALSRIAEGMSWQLTNTFSF